MKKIDSFMVDHTKMGSGLYVSRKDKKDGVVVTTYDIRVTKPNIEPPMDVPAIHTTEHLMATFLRNSEQGSEVVYFGPMGCRTGFYLLMFGERTPQEVLPLVKQAFEFILDFTGDIPGADVVSCGNYREQNLDTAKHYAKQYLNSKLSFKY